MFSFVPRYNFVNYCPCHVFFHLKFMTKKIGVPIYYLVCMCVVIHKLYAVIKCPGLYSKVEYPPVSVISCENEKFFLKDRAYCLIYAGD